MSFTNIINNIFPMKSTNCPPIDNSFDCTTAKCIQTLLILAVFMLLVYFFVIRKK
jgi:hypothetical protein